jgi:twitching motility two-component system response regulator PilH
MSKIAIVEDSAATVDVMERALRGADHEVYSFLDTSDVESELERLQPAVVLLDVVMPGRNGYEILRKLRRTPSTAGIPVVLVSSKKEPSDIEWGLRQGASGYLPKPFSEADLIGAVTEALRR